MMQEKLIATYLIETPLEVGKVAAIMAGEQSCGTFTRVAGETDELRRKAAAEVLNIVALEPRETPSLTSQYLERKGYAGPYQRARVSIAFPLANIGGNLTALAAIVGGNLFDLGEVTGLRLLDIRPPQSLRERFSYPAQGIEGTRDLLKVRDRPLFGTIIKPNVGMSPKDTASLVETLCEAGTDFIKDDEISVDPAHAPITERIKAVMAKVRDYQQRSGRKVMIAFNISDEVDNMRRHAELVEKEGGLCVMVSLNWCGLSAVQSLRKSSKLVIHAHRNGYGAMSRHPLLGIGYRAYQTIYRLAGVDQLHVHGMGGKFCNPDEEVADSALHCLEPLVKGGPAKDRVLPVFSSGQWAGNIGRTHQILKSPDFLFLAGGGILAHPAGPAAGVKSLLQGWQAVDGKIPLEKYARTHVELGQALEFFGPR
jgi:ribulose-bisphosphate carboxylase large chain